MARRARNRDGGLAEAPFQQQVTNLASFYGWLAYHTYDSRRSAPGFPDLVLVRGAELLFIELKTDSGRVRAEQRDWIAALAVVQRAAEALTDAADELVASGACAEPGLFAIEVHLWRPVDFDTLHERLARGRHRQQPTYRGGPTG